MNKKNQISDEFMCRFVNNFSDLVQRMRSCLHYIDIRDYNIHHVEGDIWTHTCLVYKDLINDPQYQELSAKDQKILCISVLFHDVGKLSCRYETYDGKVKFKEHEKKSAITIIENKDVIQFVFGVSEVDFILILKLVGGHHCHKDGLVYVNKWLGYDSRLILLYNLLCRADINGRFIDFEKANKTGKYQDVYRIEPDNNHHIRRCMSKDDKVVIFVMGLPSSGKRCFIDGDKGRYREGVYKLNYNMVSLYDARLKLYSTAMNKEISEVDYVDALEYCKNREDEVSNEFNKSIQDAVNNENQVTYISKPLMSKRDRNKLVKLVNSYCKDVKIMVLYIIADIKKCIISDSNRKLVLDKPIGTMGLRRILYNLELPSINEDGIDYVEYICKSTIDGF